ncbi:1,4-benzoquinone reductase [Pterulicium gracile]|uniref:1,4-benzoquinone reductase n=1 Tax=Pterulicium gracile TaxID=1884261 RepID=A0A5C3Q1N4_9AGAR|nr:1,4-benzoquinone reductase [Pterula gracilis]
MYGHIAKMAEAVKAGVGSAGGSATIYQIPETLSDDILAKMHAPAKPDYPVIKPADLTQYDAFLLGVPTRYGNFPAQWKVRGSFQLFLLDIFSRLSWQSFWDATGGLWASGALLGKYAGVFVSTGTPGGGQETTVISTLSTLAHHGIIYVPMGYGEAFHILSNLSEVRGGSPWGSGTFSAGDGSRQPSELEIQLAIHHGKYFYNTVKKAF